MVSNPLAPAVVSIATMIATVFFGLSKLVAGVVLVAMIVVLVSQYMKIGRFGGAY